MLLATDESLTLPLSLITLYMLTKLNLDLIFFFFFKDDEPMKENTDEASVP